jgi:TusA-related sulfurtransferase
MTPDTILDAGESGCGELVMLIARHMKTLMPGAVLEVRAYDPAAEVDIAAWCRMTGQLLLEQQLDARPQRFLIQKRR